MSNKTTLKEIFISKSDFKEINSSFKKYHGIRITIFGEAHSKHWKKFISEQHHNEIVKQYEKKIGELMDRLVVKQDEVIELLEKTK